MRNITGFLLLQLQKSILYISYYICRPFVTEEKNLWVIGVTEIANYMHTLSRAFDKSYTVNLFMNKYYANNSYNFNIAKYPLPIRFFISYFIAPILLGYLANRSTNFSYLWSTGFLISAYDGRAFEFSFLKNRGKRIIVLFMGDDIRSPKLSYEHGQSIGQETMISNLKLITPDIINDNKEVFLRKIAKSTDAYSDYIFNAPVDQISYLKRNTHPFIHFYPDDNFKKNDGKFKNVSEIVIVHAPTSPIIKGTPLIRAAIKKLQLEGYKFKYIELMDVDNNEVIRIIRDAHIVVNQLYAFAPSIFGLEAMAAHCALITSADPSIETTIPEGADKAWLITRYWEIYDHLKYLLDNPELMKQYADAGYDWAWKNCRTSASSVRIKQILDDN